MSRRSSQARPTTIRTRKVSAVAVGRFAFNLPGDPHAYINPRSKRSPPPSAVVPSEVNGALTGLGVVCKSLDDARGGDGIDSETVACYRSLRSTFLIRQSWYDCQTALQKLFADTRLTSPIRADTAENIAVCAGDRVSSRDLTYPARGLLIPGRRSFTHTTGHSHWYHLSLNLQDVPSSRPASPR